MVRRRSILRHSSVRPLHTSQPMQKPRAKLATRPYSTFTHSDILMPPTPFWMAMAAPERPAMRLWLSLVGMPNIEATTLYTTIENRAAHRAMRASWVSPPKSTMLLMVEATELLMRVITSTPKKLNAALRRMAGRGRMHRVVMQVAMALGASVQPLTKITPKVRSTVIKSTGLWAIALIKYENDTSICFPYLPSSLPEGRAAPWKGTRGGRFFPAIQEYHQNGATSIKSEIFVKKK